MKLPIRMLTVGVTVAGSFAIGQSLTIQIQSIKDNTLYQSATGALSNGAGPYMFAGRNGALEIRRGLVGFDVDASIPAGATITAARLILYMSRTTVGEMSVSLHRALQDWGEGTSVAGLGGGGGAAATAGDATWLHTFYNTSTWTTAGGTYAASASASTGVGDVGAYTWSSVQLASDVQSMLDAPGADFGWVIVGSEANEVTAKRFETRESTTADHRPTLVVDYELVPEPATLATLGLGFVLAARRRRT